MGYTFISYSHNNTTFVTFLARALRQRDVPYWLDTENVRPPAIWDEVIHEALKNAGRLIVVMSPEAMVSREVEAEWKYAFNHGIPIIPVYFRTVDDIPYRLEHFQYIDFRTGNSKDNLEQLIKTLKTPVEATRKSEPIGDDPTLFIEQLTDENWHIRLDAVDTLLKMATGAAVFVLAQALLTEKNPYICERIGIGLSQTSSEGPFREHQTIHLGTGIFAGVSISDGLAPFSDDWLRNNHTRIQTIPFERYNPMLGEHPTDTGPLAKYNTQTIWMRVHWEEVISHLPSGRLDGGTIRLSIFRGRDRQSGKTVGEIDFKLLKTKPHIRQHGFICNLPITIKDVIVADAALYVVSKHNKEHYQTIVFYGAKDLCSIVIGPDVYRYYDSFMYRGGSM